eukprot:CAMPEP_0195594068 /NCGR_PEP_ID=MMETSP0815-20121206/1224_1 /TAXON_ID=97485 /ORGANISM="Prymnesium parvum, Strain Texoma1" /LENGTH=150 /DNA_ID=CAMNT_0040733257 /DNA_START=169 /DNA_END=619 /DNA_ORIENTATION=-
MPASPCYLGGRREDWQAVGTTAGNENLKLLDTTGEQLEINGTAAVAWKPLGAQGVLHERRVATVRCALVAQGSAASLGAAPCTGEDTAAWGQAAVEGTPAAPAARLDPSHAPWEARGAGPAPPRRPSSKCRTRGWRRQAARRAAAAAAAA